MNMHLNFFKSEENTEGDNPPIGIVLGADKMTYWSNMQLEAFQTIFLFLNIRFTYLIEK